jgi:glycosyltransferase involved in cell wall biosynthesis
MLGWEFPPFITGGLGTACAGLTRALAKQGTDLTFVLPGPADPDAVEHMQIIAPGLITSPACTTHEPSQQPSTVDASATPHNVAADPVDADPVDADPVDADPVAKPLESPQAPSHHGTAAERPTPTTANLDVNTNTGAYASAYGPGTQSTPAEAVQWAAESDAILQKAHGDSSRSFVDHRSERTTRAHPITQGQPNGTPPYQQDTPHQGPHNISADHTTPIDLGDADDLLGEPRAGDTGGNDIIDEVRQFADFANAAVANLEFDVIHAHDWLTWPAALRIARRTGKPLIVHVHSTEFDRSGESVHPVIHDIERRGMLGAMRVITVSQLTHNIVVERYGVDPAKVTVVYNGVEIDPLDSGLKPIGRREKIILYFGRITRQKGPEFFIRAAARVLERRQDVRFVVAGSGDLYQRCVELAAELGIGQHFLFTGFLQGTDIQRVFSMADLFVMPSVSEPFGIAPLEAMSHDVPVLISKSSGVSEVLTHALKVDFWDTEAMADKMLAVLRYPPLGRTLRRSGPMDIRRLTWDDAARKCRKAYEEVAAAMGSAVHQTPA